MTDNCPPSLPESLLQHSDKILFILHLAIGDYTYMQNGFRALKERYPHLQIDLFIDERRRTSDSSKWPALANYSLYDWLKDSIYFNKIYSQTYSPDGYQEAVLSAQREQYPIVCALTTVSQHRYAELALKIAGKSGVTVATEKKPLFFQWNRKEIYQKIDYLIPAYRRASGFHISEQYAAWFNVIGDITLRKEERYPFIDIPRKWQEWADYYVLNYTDREQKQLIFINAFAKNSNRCWPLEHVVTLIQTLQEERGEECLFFINALPEDFAAIVETIGDEKLTGVVPFSAQESFYQLPALLAKMDLIISVETAVMHLANAVNVPVLALMRRKNPEWRPINSEISHIITTKKMHHHISEIMPERVLMHLREKGL